MPQSEHLSKQYDQDLDDIRSRVLEMGGLVESQIQMALDAFARSDAAEAARVVKEDAAIDAEFLAILRQLITFMMEEPRTIGRAIGVVWIAKAVERIGDHAKNIAEQVIYIVKGADVRHTDMANVERQALG